jgi:hypothetical protein
MKRGRNVTVIAQEQHEDGGVTYYKGELDEDEVVHLGKLMSLRPKDREKLVNKKKDLAETQVLHKIFKYELEEERYLEDDILFEVISDKDIVQYTPCHFLMFYGWD